MPAPLSAVDAISPAFARTKRLLLQPFRFGFWVRLGLVALVTGESLSGGWGGSSGFNFPFPRGSGDNGDKFLLLADPSWERALAYIPWIIAGGIAVFALGLLWTYVSSVFRFILLDAVLNDRCRLGEGWRRWQSQGFSYFLWQIVLSVAMIASLAVLFGLPVLLAWRAGIFRQADQHVGLLVAGGVGLFFLFIAWVVLGALVALFAKDFVIPFMALEGLGVLAAWRRVLPLLRVEKMAYAGYVLMKIVLAVGSAVLFGIINVILFLVVFVLLGLVGAGLFLAGKAAGLTWDAYTIGAVVVLGVAVLAGLLYLLAFVFVPAMVFFQSYTLHFLGSRYPLLDSLLHPPPPAAAPAAAAPAPSPAS